MPIRMLKACLNDAVGLKELRCPKFIAFNKLQLLKLIQHNQDSCEHEYFWSPALVIQVVYQDYI